MTGLLSRIEERLFAAADTVCLERARLATAAFAAHESEPAALRTAHVFAHVLANMTLDLASNPVFAGNTSTLPRAWMLVPEFGFAPDAQVLLEHDGLEGFPGDHVPADLLAFWRGRSFGGNAGIGHMSVDFDMVVNAGLHDVLRRLQRHAGAGDERQRAMRDAMAISCRAVIAWAERYASAAAHAAATETDPVVASCLRRMAAACRHVPAAPARNLFEALQAIALVHLATVLEGQGMSMSIGLPDRALRRFAGEVAADPDAAVSLIRAFILKIAANSFLGRGSKTQAITIGGGGSDGCEAVTQAFLEAFERTPVSDPHLFLRWHGRLSPAIRAKALDMLSAGRSMPMLVNDDAVLPGLLARGVTRQDAADYCVIGCNELGIPGRCCQSAFALGLAFNEMELLNGVVRGLSGDAGTGEVLDGFEAAVAASSRKGLAGRLARQAEHVASRPFPFCSACCSGCAEAGADLLEGMPYPRILGLYVRGTTNAINVLSAIDELVVRRGRYRLPQLIAAIDAADPAALEATAAAPAWGNDDEAADRLGVALVTRRQRALDAVAAEAGLPPFAVCHVVRSLHHVDGRRIGPTLDGRPGGAPVADSVGAAAGAAGAGPTAMLRSVLKLRAGEHFAGICNLNLTLPGGAPSAPGVIGALADAFFSNGGQELQVAVLDAAQLRAAQRHPEQHRSLVVRVAGLNARFVELSRLEQEELIRRSVSAGGPDAGPGDGVAAAAATLREARPPGQLASIRRQLAALVDLAGREGFAADAAVAIGISGGRLRIAFMHPDMNRFFGPAWQMPIGAAGEDGDEQIVLLAQPSDDGQIHLLPADPKYREIVNAIPAANDVMYPDGSVTDLHAYEVFGTHMSETVLLSLGYFSEAELATRRERGLPLPPPALWVSSNMRRPFSLVGNVLASLRTLREGPIGNRVQQQLGREGFRGLRLACTGGIPTGGFSSSSALTLATKNAINALFDLRIPADLLVHLACQAEYGTGVRAGSLDQATEQKGAAGCGTLISSNPADNYRVLGTYPVPSGRFRILFPYSVERDREAWRWSGGFYGENSSGPRLTAGEMRKLTGKAAEMAAMLTRLPLDQDFFRIVQADLLGEGRLGTVAGRKVADLLRAVPLLLPREQLRDAVREERDWLIGALMAHRRLEPEAAIQQAEATLTGLFAGWREPVLRRPRKDGTTVEETGVPLRAMLAYLFAEMARNFHLIHHPDSWIASVSASQRGDRCFSIEPDRAPGRARLESELPWERDVSGPARLERWLEVLGATPFDHQAGLTDAELAADPPPDLRHLAGGGFFRGLALIDLAEALLHRAFGSEAVAVRVNAAGQGDFFQVHVDTAAVPVEDVKQFLHTAFYRRFGINHEPAFVEPHPGGPATGVRLERFSDLGRLVAALG